MVKELPRGSDLRSKLESLRGRILENWQSTGTMEKILKEQGFKFKVITCSRDKYGPSVRKQGGTILDITWNLWTDTFSTTRTANT